MLVKAAFALFLALVLCGSNGVADAGPAPVCPAHSSYWGKLSHYHVARVNSPYDRKCRMEGTCVYSRGGSEIIKNHGKRPEYRSSAHCKWGIGAHGRCLRPCESLAADLRYHGVGETIYVPALRGIRCDGKILDGFMTVEDSGDRIRGAGRFDFFFGDCNRALPGDHCHDPRFAEVRAVLKRGRTPFCSMRRPRKPVVAQTLQPSDAKKEKPAASMPLPRARPLLVEELAEKSEKHELVSDIPRVGTSFSTTQSAQAPLTCRSLAPSLTGQIASLKESLEQSN